MTTSLSSAPASQIMMQTRMSPQGHDRIVHHLDRLFLSARPHLTDLIPHHVRVARSKRSRVPSSSWYYPAAANDRYNLHLHDLPPVLVHLLYGIQNRSTDCLYHFRINSAPHPGWAYSTTARPIESTRNRPGRSGPLWQHRDY